MTPATRAAPAPLAGCLRCFSTHRFRFHRVPSFSRFAPSLLTIACRLLTKIWCLIPIPDLTGRDHLILTAAGMLTRRGIGGIARARDRLPCGSPRDPDACSIWTQREHLAPLAGADDDVAVHACTPLGLPPSASPTQRPSPSPRGASSTADPCRLAQKHTRAPRAAHDDQSVITLMLRWAVTFLIIALIAGLFGFGLIAGTAIGLAKIIFFVFLVLCVLAFIMGRRAPRA